MRVVVTALALWTGVSAHAIAQVTPVTSPSQTTAVTPATGLYLATAAPTAHPAATPSSAALPAFNTISEDLSEQRRAVFVRLERRLAEADLLRVGEYIKEHAKRPFARTQVNYFLPGMPLNLGPWASIQFAPEPKIMVHGLRREDEELFLAEHQADRRSLLGAWLTSPPAAPGRLTIYSDRGRVYAEWRLRNGQKTLDELADSAAKAGRRFDVQGGGYYILAKSGELEIWDKTTLIAVAERIRPEHLTLPTAVALGPKLPPIITMAPTAPRPAASEMVASPAQPEPSAAAGVAAVTPRSTAQIATTPLALDPEPIDPKGRPKKVKKSRAATQPTARPTRAQSSHGLTPGDQMAAKMSGR